jgi:DUF4097 and DUF4098 domain-containing protein YvlB
MKKWFPIFISPLLFLFYGASLDNIPLSIGPCFIFSVDNNKEINNVGKDDKSNLHKEFNIEEGKTLNIDLNSGGAIFISGWDKNMFSADVEASENNLKDFSIDINKTGDGVEVESSLLNEEFHNGGLKFIIKVPSRFNLKINTMGGGITINNINGEIKGKTMGGPLDLSSLKGELDLQTMGGPVKLYDSDVNGRVHTMGGPVEITNVKGDIKGTTNGGPVIMKNVTLKGDSGSGDAVSISSMGGDINVDEAPAGADIKTLGGSIKVKTAKKFVNAKTYGGNIDIEKTEGSIDASTMGGDITAEMVGEPKEENRNVNLSSKAGDITLTVPENLSMDIDITLAYTKRNEDRYKIYSDFPLKQETTSDWDHTKGSSRKYIYGKGKIGSGKNKITIQTVNGNVYLKKE